ncbi:geranylgeranylglyceryl/heptaprenylglyceryl phosphate synthase [uncultured Dokdonia sp.]|uniref:geranylgeranylglyceryl/heptaprenylglyceryl phosphate synthase n=1 Tax=uncultured Dokdonia sp. TaxID=575653 RepID=UPI0026036DD5|nr:geranylgeranylglyceryl/heptaprenylglyceryl phosphate synthase [uncultured Dokdonia sp.]
MNLYQDIHTAQLQKKQLLAILIDPDKFVAEYAFAKAYLEKVPSQTTHFLVGGSTDASQNIEAVVRIIKKLTTVPVILFPGDYTQITSEADGILFLSLLSGRNPEYLIGQQVKGASHIQKSHLEVIPTGYILIDGGKETAVQRVSGTLPISQKEIDTIVHTALAGQYLGKKCIYLEAGSGAQYPVSTTIIKAVREAIDIPLLVGGGIRSQKAMQDAYDAGATMVVIGTAFEEDRWNT